MNKQDILDAYKKLQRQYPDIPMTRDRLVHLTPVTKHAVRTYFGTFNRLKLMADGNPDVGDADARETYTKSAHVTSPVAATLDELITKAQIDLDKWDVTKIRFNEWGSDTNYNAQCRAELKPKITIDIDELVESFKRRVEQYVKPAALQPDNLYAQGDNAYVMAISDFHLGQLAWDHETGWGSYDLKIARELYRRAARDLVSRVDPAQIEVIYFLVGSDFFNTDTIQDTTTAGTYQSQDGRWPKMFTMGCELLTEVLEEISARFKVETVFVQGNHDEMNSFFLAHYLDAFFRHNPNVDIDTAPRKRKYVRYGNVLLGFTHGDKEKQNDLPLIMAQEARESWSGTKYAHWLTGHLHHQMIKEYNGVKVEILPSLIPPDSWHTSHGYVGNSRVSKSLLFNHNKGLIAEYHFNAEDEG